MFQSTAVPGVCRDMVEKLCPDTPKPRWDPQPRRHEHPPATSQQESKATFCVALNPKGYPHVMDGVRVLREAWLRCKTSTRSFTVVDSLLARTGLVPH